MLPLGEQSRLANSDTNEGSQRKKIRHGEYVMYINLFLDSFVSIKFIKEATINQNMIRMLQLASAYKIAKELFASINKADFNPFG